MKLNKDIYDVYKPLVPYMPEKATVGYGYVPYQINPEYLEIDEAFEFGTLFPDLVTPYSSYLIREV
ncbi:spore coat associated protein CotJA [Sedimentibacter sp. zth1]|uniref:spore coat associated protein CotJA n=1 Tax=Sedimentibacter sp. zth1 TaxID=2816908 RepID=UPI001A92928C|nr:spore coat associated protein CotJA [Sedimentibacter sp. zth1]QSX05481.1 spore coat associated protein CotJA [Sedimentibacter sp. zth1]